MRMLLACLLTGAICLNAESTATGQEVWLTDLNQARELAETQNRPILCHFYADWCLPCRQMESSVFPSQRLQDQLKQSVIAVKIDTKKYPHLAHRFHIKELPTDIIIEPNGAEILQSTGYRNLDEYVGLVLRARTRYADLLASRTPSPVVGKSGDGNEGIPVAGTEGKPPVKQPNAPQQLMLDGFCPVTLWKSRRWEPGDVRHQVEYKGQLYRFGNESLKREFEASPERYVPQYLGCDPVIVWETDRAVAGSIQFGAFYDEKLYLFTTTENRKKFKSAPDRFIKTQVVLHVDQVTHIQ